MTVLKYEKEIVALLVIDPYSDFISEGGKIWNRIKGVADGNNCVLNNATTVDDNRPLTRPSAHTALSP